MPEEINENFFKAVCQNANIAIIATDAKTNIRFCNPAATRLFEGSTETMLGQPVISIIPAEYQKLAATIVDRALSGGEAGEMEIRYPNATATPAYLVLMISPILDENGARTGASILVRDISRRIEGHKAAVQTEKMSALSSMAGAVAQHFNNLLCALVTTADFAQSSSDPEVLRRALRTIISTLTRASKITLAMQAFAEGDHGTTDREEAAGLIERFIETLRPLMTQRGITLKIDLQPVSAILPVRQVTTILNSLITNAYEAMPTGGTLEISLAPSPDGQNAIIRVADTGQGIPEENLQHVFEPFFSSKPDSATDSVQHRGLSLAVAHGIVRSLGGSITFCSGTKDGTVFAVQLPANPT